MIVGALELRRYQPSGEASEVIEYTVADPHILIHRDLLAQIYMDECQPWASIDSMSRAGAIVKFHLSNGGLVYVLGEYDDGRNAWSAHWPD